MTQDVAIELSAMEINLPFIGVGVEDYDFGTWCGRRHRRAGRDGGNHENC